jgi:hypothetical protein
MFNQISQEIPIPTIYAHVFFQMGAKSFAAIFIRRNKN